MAPRRSARSINASNHNNYNNLTLTDALCPICRSILIEPVTLPCNHGFCSSCFEGTVANANLVCPLCRVRISSWLRTSRKDNKKLINVALWNVIQKAFPKQVKNKLDGVEEYHDEVTPRLITVPGEIRREFESEKMKNDLELQKEREAERKASEDYIKQLREKEEYEEVVHEENIRLSEQMAKKLSQKYCFDPGPSSSGVTIKKQVPIDKLLQNLSKKKVTVTLQPSTSTTKKYTSKNLCQNKTVQDVNKILDKTALLNTKIQEKLKKVITERDAADSNDSIDSECRFFKPIEQRFVPFSKKVPVLKVPALIRTASTVIIGPPKGETNFKHSNLQSAFALVKVITLPSPTANLNEQTPPLSNSSETLSQSQNLIRYSSPAKRKRVRSRECHVKKSRIDLTSSPFHGYENKSLNVFTTKSNGAITHFSNINEVCDDLKKRQEEDDFKYATKLQEELNNKGRYYTRNNYSVQIKNIKKPLARQVTLKEIISHTVNKIPQ